MTAPPGRFATARWSLDLPAGMTGCVVQAPPECTSMAHVSGELAPSAPAMVIVSSRALEGGTVPRLARTLAESCVAPPPRPRAIAVPGAKQAVRLDGLIRMEEGLTADGVERIAIVVAKRRGEAVALTVRTRPADDVDAAVEALIASFAILREPR
jgi:hypothetical protein